ncbi:hypothetical protein ScPMuIL_016376 [Solemya velum]
MSAKEGFQFQNTRHIPRQTVDTIQKERLLPCMESEQEITPHQTTRLIRDDTKLSKLQDKTDNEMDGWKRKRHLFTETEVFFKYKDKLKQNNRLHLIGLSGEGKTAMAKELLHQPGRTPIIIKKSKHWDCIDVKEGIQNVWIDDIFGKSSLENRRKMAWLCKVSSNVRKVEQPRW